MNKNILLQLKDIHVHYGGVKALDGISLKINEGEIVALMGPNPTVRDSRTRDIIRSARPTCIQTSHCHGKY